MTNEPLYSFDECMELIKDCRFDELVALSSLLIEEWKCYTMAEQELLLRALVKSRKSFQVQNGRNYLYLKNRSRNS